MNVLVDVGGSGVRMAQQNGRTIGTIRNFQISSKEDFIRRISETANGSHISGIALSVAGFVNSEKGVVILSRNASYLEGNLVSLLKSRFPLAKVRLVNDGEAHACSLLCQGQNVKFGAIHLAFGTSVAFGVLDENKKVIRTCGGENWDIGDFCLKTSASMPEAYFALGSAGLRELESKLGSGAYRQFGYRIGGLLNQLATIFRPRTIGLSGGIIVAHANELRPSILEEFHNPVGLDVKILLLPEKDTVMKGLSTLLS